MKTLTKVLALSLIVFTMVSCEAIKSAFQLKNCEYTYHSISGIKVAGIDCSSTSSVLQLSNITKIATLIAGNFKELPLEMIINVNVKNPGQVAAAISNIDYSVNIDNLNVASGDLQKSFRVEPGKTAVLPVGIKTDLANLLNKENRSQVIAIAKNFAGISDQASTVKLSLRPTLYEKRKMPAIPISFKYNGKKNK